VPIGVTRPGQNQRPPLTSFLGIGALFAPNPGYWSPFQSRWYLKAKFFDEVSHIFAASETTPCQCADESVEELFQFQHIVQRIGEPITRGHFAL
jgi:hypothetical protein